MINNLPPIHSREFVSANERHPKSVRTVPWLRAACGNFGSGASGAMSFFGWFLSGRIRPNGWLFGRSEIWPDNRSAEWLFGRAAVRPNGQTFGRSAVRPHCLAVGPNGSAERPNSAAERPKTAAEQLNSLAERPNSLAERQNYLGLPPS